MKSEAIENNKKSRMETKKNNNIFSQKLTYQSQNKMENETKKL